jgi:hypothetical protein
VRVNRLEVGLEVGLAGGGAFDEGPQRRSDVVDVSLRRSSAELERSRDEITDSIARMQRFFPTVNISATS